MSLCWNGEKRRKEEIFIEAKDGGRWSKAPGGFFGNNSTEIGSFLVPRK
jgi:hypothetical protein